MSVSDYITKLLPTFESSRVKDTLTDLSKEIDQFTLPTVQGLIETFPHDWKWKSKNVSNLDKAIRDSYNGKVFKRDASSLELIERALTNLQVALPLMKLQADKAFGTMIASEGLTFDKASILQYAEAAVFFINYTRRLTNYISAAEVAELSNSRSVKGISPDDEEFLLANRYTFGIALNVMVIDGKTLKEDMRMVPAVAVSPDTESDMRVVAGNSKMDPFGLTTLPFPLSFVFRAGMVMVNWQLSNYDAAQEEANVQQHRMILLKEIIESGKSDAATENALADAEERLLLANRSLAKMEEEYGVYD